MIIKLIRDKICNILVILILILNCNANAFFYEEPDKNLHVGVSMAGTFVISSTLLLNNPKLNSRDAVLIAGATMLVLGLAKESLVDNHFSGDDMLANTLGVGMGSIPFILIEF